MSNVSQWSTTAASNNSTPPDGMPEGQAPSTVNDTVREIMAALARWYSDTDGSLTTGGSGTAYTLTTNNSHAALADQSIIVFRAHAACGDDPTLNVDSLGAKNLKKEHDVNLQTNDVEQDQIVAVVYNATDDTYEVISKLASAGRQTLWVPAAAMIPTVSNGCASLQRTETTAARPDVQGLAFDDTADEFAQFVVAFPKSWDDSTINYQAYWTALSGGAGGVAWQLQGVAMSDDDTIDVAYGTAVVVTDTSHGAAEDLQITGESGDVTVAGTPADADMVAFRIGRDVSDAADTLAEDATLLGVRIFIGTNQASDD